MEKGSSPLGSAMKRSCFGRAKKLVTKTRPFRREELQLVERKAKQNHSQTVNFVQESRFEAKRIGCCDKS